VTEKLLQLRRETATLNSECEEHSNNKVQRYCVIRQIKSSHIQFIVNDSSGWINESHLQSQYT